MWDTSGSSYCDNVRSMAYPDSDAVFICFDLSQVETLHSVLKKWQGDTHKFCPNAKVVLVGYKLAVLRELSKQQLIPVTHEQGTALAKQIGAVLNVSAPPAPPDVASGMSSRWPQQPPLAVDIGSCSILTHARNCSSPLSWQNGQTGG